MPMGDDSKTNGAVERSSIEMGKIEDVSQLAGQGAFTAGGGSINGDDLAARPLVPVRVGLLRHALPHTVLSLKQGQGISAMRGVRQGPGFSAGARRSNRRAKVSSSLRPAALNGFRRF
jgi:hypothetical protein